MSGGRDLPAAIVRAAQEAIARVVARSIRAQDRGDVVNSAFAKFLPHAWRLTIEEVPAYATRVAKSACADHMEPRERTPKTNEPLVDRVVVSSDSENEPGGGLEPNEPAGARLLAWFDANAASVRLRLGPQERRYLQEIRAGQTHQALAKLLAVSRSRVYELTVSVGSKARILAERSDTRRLRDVQ